MRESRAPHPRDSNHPRYFSPEQKEIALVRQFFQCGGCGKDLWRLAPRMQQAHHIVQAWQGGATVEENLVVLCPTCHVEADNAATLHGRIYSGPGESIQLCDADDSMMRGYVNGSLIPRT